jgi:hypothetical protein
MDILVNQNKSDKKRTGAFFGWLKAVTTIARRLVRFLYLSDDDQAKAGIYLDYDK